MIGSLVVSISGRQVRPGRGVIIGGDRSDRVQGLLLGEQTRAGVEHIAPELGLALIDPEQAVLHRHAVIGRPQILAAAILAVPAMGIFVRQQIVVAKIVFPFGEIAGADAVFRAAMMLQPDAAETIGDREQEIIMVVMLRAEQLHRLLDQLACVARSAPALRASSASLSAITLSVTSGLSGIAR